MSKINNRIVLCGSMSQYGIMQCLKDRLSNGEIEVVIPLLEENKEEKAALKKEYSIRHFKEVTDERTTAILVVNCPKNGEPNYIGANTFAEIAFAFYHKKTIFILEDIYNSYRDELISWEAITLKGNINSIHNYLNGLCYSFKGQGVFE